MFDELHRWAQEHGFPTSTGSAAQSAPSSDEPEPEDQPRRADRRAR
jgi:hypothetical protein